MPQTRYPQSWITPRSFQKQHRHAEMTPKPSSAPFCISIHPQTDVQTCPVVGGGLCKKSAHTGLGILLPPRWPIHAGTYGSILFPVTRVQFTTGWPSLPGELQEGGHLVCFVHWWFPVSKPGSGSSYSITIPRMNEEMNKWRSDALKHWWTTPFSFSSTQWCGEHP